MGRLYEREPLSVRLTVESRLGSFGNRGNGRYRQELRQGLAAIMCYLKAYQLSSEYTLLRLDGQYATGAVLADVAGFAFVTRGKEYTVLDHPLVQVRLLLPPDQFQQRPESRLVRSLYDCPEIPVGPEGVRCRVVVATHPIESQKSRVGVTRSGIVYELFFTNLPQQAFTAIDVVELYLHRGAFEPVLSDEDQEIDPDRWCSHTACGQEAWCVVSQWVWNLRLEFGHQLQPDPIRTVSRLLQLPPRSKRSSPTPAGMANQRWPWSSKRVASPGRILCSSLMVPCVVLPTNLLWPMNDAEKLMAVCASCMGPASAVVVPVRYASNANGVAGQRPNRARSAFSSIPWSSVLLRSSGKTGVGGIIGGPAFTSFATSV